MNVHPLFVHFPIALLTVYCLMEMARIRKIMNLPFWWYTKAFLLIIGTISAYVAKQTGEFAAGTESDTISRNPLLDMHSEFAEWTTLLFTILTILYTLTWLYRTDAVKSALQRRANSRIYPTVERVCRIATRITAIGSLMFLAAIMGLTLVSVTGALGGAMVYGPDVDPFVAFVINALHKFRQF